MIGAVLFDWGDTLFRKPSAPDVIVEFARERGLWVDRGRAERLWNELWEASKTAEEHAKGRDLSPEGHRRVWTELLARAEALVPGVATVLYERVMDPARWRPYADAGPTLRALRQRGVKVGVVSNVPSDLRPFFARHGLADLVDAFVLSGEQGVAKPDPALFLAACRALGTRPDQTLMVGDDPVSDGGAARAGLRLHVLQGEPSGEARGLAVVLALVDAANGALRRGRENVE